MARKIIWAKKAAIEKDAILAYWLKRNQSNVYPKKLSTLFHQATKWLSKNPLTGRRTSAEGVRVKVVRDYLLFYKFDDKTVFVLAIWDMRRDPAKRPFKF